MEENEKVITTREIRNKITLSILSKHWRRNFKENIQLIKTCKTVWDLPLIKKPAIAIGAGPSLLKNRKLLKDWDITLICSDAALPMIKEYSTPEYIISANADEPTSPGKFIESKGLKLITPVVVHPDTFNDWKGEIYFYIPHILPEDLKEEVKTLNIEPLTTGSNEGIIAYMMAVFLGRNPIALIGMDFSFKTKKACEKVTYGPLIIANDINKQPVWTNMLWYDSSMEFFQIARAFYKKGLKTVNCTEGGILYDRFAGPDGRLIFPPVIFIKTLEEFKREINENQP